MEDMDGKPEDYDPKDSIKKHPGYPAINNEEVQVPCTASRAQITNGLNFDHPATGGSYSLITPSCGQTTQVRALFLVLRRRLKVNLTLENTGI